MVAKQEKIGVPQGQDSPFWSVLTLFYFQSMKNGECQEMMIESETAVVQNF